MTSKTLVLLRHAKAEPPDAMADIDRPLTPRGHADSAAAGSWLARGGYLPDLVICSPAKRTRQTWHGVALGMAEPSAATAGVPVAGDPVGRAPTVRYEARVYQGRVQDLLTLVQTAEDGASTILLVGHNPTISEVSLLLDPTGDRDSDGLQTSGLAVHQLDGSWVDLAPGAAPLAAWYARGD